MKHVEIHATATPTGKLLAAVRAAMRMAPEKITFVGFDEVVVAPHRQTLTNAGIAVIAR